MLEISTFPRGPQALWGRFRRGFVASAMEKIVHQLVELLLGAVPTFLIVLVLFVFLRIVFFGPLKKVLAERHARTGGAKDAAAASMAAAETKASEYSKALEQARAEVYRQRESDRQKALAARADLVAKTRATAEQKVAQARKEVEAETTTARDSLKQESQRLAESITRMILK